jgi:hypothetical protein
VSTLVLHELVDVPDVVVVTTVNVKVEVMLLEPVAVIISALAVGV